MTPSSPAATGLVARLRYKRATVRRLAWALTRDRVCAGFFHLDGHVANRRIFDVKVVEKYAEYTIKYRLIRIPRAGHDL